MKLILLSKEREPEVIFVQPLQFLERAKGKWHPQGSSGRMQVSGRQAHPLPCSVVSCNTRSWQQERRGARGERKEPRQHPTTRNHLPLREMKAGLQPVPLYHPRAEAGKLQPPGQIEPHLLHTRFSK